ncbi:MAG: hypothetical protein II755_06820, partial [Prevotella sp.]|nr:hypothetical protein [Prevotella sp.]
APTPERGWGLGFISLIEKIIVVLSGLKFGDVTKNDYLRNVYPKRANNGTCQTSPLRHLRLQATEA